MVDLQTAATWSALPFAHSASECLSSLVVECDVCERPQEVAVCLANLKLVVDVLIAQHCSGDMEVAAVVMTRMAGSGNTDCGDGGLGSKTAGSHCD